MNLLLDSTVLIDLLRHKKNTLDFMARAVQQGDELATASINVGEVFSFLLPAEERNAESIFAAMHIYPLTTQIARHAGLLRYAWGRKGRTLALSDTIVAATALEYGLTLVTDNRKDFPMPELVFFDLA